MNDETLIPDKFWSNAGGPWYYSNTLGVHDAVTHESCPDVDVPQAIEDNDLDTISTVCHVIE